VDGEASFLVGDFAQRAYRQAVAARVNDPVEFFELGELRRGHAIL
jgi:hypothetical protein